jgi:isoquinoline 1-oxidoreductase beta subunit
MKDQLTRRDFIKLVGAAGGGLVLAVYLDACASDAPIPATVTPLGPTSTPRPPFDWAPNIYLKLDQDGILTVSAFRSEMGQGIRTAIAMLIAEELDMEWSSVRIEQAPTDPKYGGQLTGGSVSISSHYSGLPGRCCGGDVGRSRRGPLGGRPGPVYDRGGIRHPSG